MKLAWFGCKQNNWSMFVTFHRFTSSLVGLGLLVESNVSRTTVSQDTSIS